ncbi:MAG: hypothetical protein HQK54_17320 [Oligoflexales bacterium]|nr:hypothetical protein [Oligoflexales bacterium]
MEFLKVLDAENVKGFELSLGYFADSNVYRIPNSVEPPLPHRSSKALNLNIDYRKKTFEDKFASSTAGVSAAYRNWSLQSLSILKTRIFWDFSLSMRNEDSAVSYIFGGYPFFDVIRSGSGGLDGFGLLLFMEQPRMKFTPRFSLASSQYFDIVRDQKMVLDPFTEEINTHTSLATRFLIFDAIFTFRQESESRLKGDLRLAQNRHVSELSTSSDYFSVLIGADYVYNYSRRLYFNSVFNLENRQYARSGEEARSDLLMELRGESVWNFSTMLDSRFFVDLLNDNSSISSNSYFKSLIGLSASYRL